MLPLLLSHDHLLKGFIDSNFWRNFKFCIRALVFLNSRSIQGNDGKGLFVCGLVQTTLSFIVTVSLRENPNNTGPMSDKKMAATGKRFGLNCFKDFL